jgi:hypothetical protein
MKRLIALSDQMADIVHFDGYTHEQLETILDGVDVGMIPVQWEDNLPQVATEMVAHGVPLITSHRGGAKELGGDNPAFVFKSSNKAALIEIWRQLIEGELQPGDYWESAVSLTTMDDHLNRLMELWANPEAPQLDVRPQVDPSEHKTHIHEIEDDDEDEQGMRLDSHPTGFSLDDGDLLSSDVTRSHFEDDRVPAGGDAEVLDSDPAIQAANSIPEAAKEAAATTQSRAAQPLGDEQGDAF